MNACINTKLLDYERESSISVSYIVARRIFFSKLIGTFSYIFSLTYIRTFVSIAGRRYHMSMRARSS